MYNVDRKVKDAFYRYRMPKLEAKVEGAGNGIKTVVVNVTEISRCLRRPPEYATKFLGNALGAQTILGDKGRYIVNGEHSAEKMQTVLDSYIEKYVLCPSCRNPETSLCCTKEKIVIRCMACGKSKLLKCSDGLYKYIVKNPPKEEDNSAEKNYKKYSATQSAEKTSSNIRAKCVSGVNPTNDANDTPEEIYQTGVIEAEDDNVEFNKYFSSLSCGKDDDQNKNAEAEWSVNLDAESVKKRKEELSTGLFGLTYTEELDLSMNDRLELFRNFVKSRLVEGTDSNAHYKEICHQVTRLELDGRSLGVVAEILFVSEDLILQSFKKHSDLFKMLIGKSENHQMYLLGIIEDLMRKYHSLIPRLNDIFSLLYDSDIVSESSFISWYQSSTSGFSSVMFFKKLKDTAAPFIEWLTTAEEEGSSEESQDEDVVFSEEQNSTDKHEAVFESPSVSSEKVPEEDLQFNIDDI